MYIYIYIYIYILESTRARATRALDSFDRALTTDTELWLASAHWPQESNFLCKNEI